MKSLPWRAVGDAVLEDFRGKDCAFVANWLRGKGLNKLCGIFEVFSATPECNVRSEKSVTVPSRLNAPIVL